MPPLHKYSNVVRYAQKNFYFSFKTRFMEVTLTDKRTTMLYLASKCFNHLESNLYKLILYKEEDAATENILEIIFLGITHLTIKMKKIIGKNAFQRMFTDYLIKFAEGYFEKHQLNLYCSVDFITLINMRIEENMVTLKTFVYENPGPIIPTFEFTRFYNLPLEVPVPNENDLDLIAVISLVPIMRNYIAFIDKIINPLTDTLVTTFKEI